MIPGLKCRLMSPQSFLDDPAYRDCNFLVTKDSTILRLQTQTVTVPYESSSRLPILQAFSNANNVTLMATKAAVVDDSNKNLTHKQKQLLK